MTEPSKEALEMALRLRSWGLNEIAAALQKLMDERDGAESELREVVRSWDGTLLRAETAEKRRTRWKEAARRIWRSEQLFFGVACRYQALLRELQALDSDDREDIFGRVRTIIERHR